MDCNTYTDLKRSQRVSLHASKDGEALPAGCVCIEQTKYDENTGEPIAVCTVVSVDDLRAQLAATQRDAKALEEMIFDLTQVAQ